MFLVFQVVPAGISECPAPIGLVYHLEATFPTKTKHHTPYLHAIWNHLLELERISLSPYNSLKNSKEW